ncbi:hypothetical protein [Rufibacter soli]
MLQLEYIPTAFDLSERAYAIAKADNLIHAVASAMVTTNHDGVSDAMLCVQAYYRKPGQTTNDIHHADSVCIMGDLKQEDEVFERFKEKVSTLRTAHQRVAA